MKVRALTLKELIGLLSDVRSDVREVSLKAVVSRTLSDNKELNKLLAQVSNGRVSASVLEELLKHPDFFKSKAKDNIIKLLNSPRSEVRSAIIRTLPQPWLNKQKTEKLLKKALKDSQASIRDQAVGALRKMKIPVQ